MNRLLTIGFVAASMAACGRVRTPAEEKAAIHESGSETAANARNAGQTLGDTSRDFGHGVAHGLHGSAEAVLYGANRTIYGIDHNATNMRARGDRERAQMHQQFEASGQNWRGFANNGSAATRDTGRTIESGATYVGDQGQHAIGTVRRAAGAQPDVTPTARGGGPNDVRNDTVHRTGDRAVTASHRAAESGQHAATTANHRARRTSTQTDERVRKGVDTNSSNRP